MCSFPVSLFSSLLPLTPNFSKILPLLPSTLAAPTPGLCHLDGPLEWAWLVGQKEEGLLLVSESSLLRVCLQGPDPSKKRKETSRLVDVDTHMCVFTFRAEPLPRCCLPSLSRSYRRRGVFKQDELPLSGCSSAPRAINLVNAGMLAQAHLSGADLFTEPRQR